MSSISLSCSKDVSQRQLDCQKVLRQSRQRYQENPIFEHDLISDPGTVKDLAKQALRDKRVMYSALGVCHDYAVYRGACAAVHIITARIMAHRQVQGREYGPILFPDIPLLLVECYGKKLAKRANAALAELIGAAEEVLRMDTCNCTQGKKAVLELPDDIIRLYKAIETALGPLREEN